MIGRHRTGAHANSKHFDQFEDPGPEPVSPMGAIPPPGLEINATKKLAPHAPGDDLIMWCGVQRDQMVAGHRHGGSAQFGLKNQRSNRATDGP